MGTPIARRYELQEEIGSGGMGTVHRAIDRLTGETVALKRLNFSAELLSHMPETVRRELLLSIANEFRVMASARHPNIATVYDYGFDRTHGTPAPYMTVELIEDAQDIVTAAAALPHDQRLNMLMQLLEAIAYLHQRDIIHCDLKPGNVLVSDIEGVPVVKVLDFGLSSDGHNRAAMSGTLAFTAPELLENDNAEPTRQSDLYSVGVIAYGMFAGRPLFHETPSAFNDIMTRIKTGTYTLDGIADEAIRAVVGKLLHVNLSERYQSAIEVQQALAAATGQPVPPESDSVLDSYLQASRFIGRDEELATLREHLSQAAAGNGRVLIITGESGIGKSRLIDELRIEALTEGFIVLQGQSVEEGGLPYQLWRDAIPPLVLADSMSNFAAGVLKSIVPNIERLLERTVPDAQEVTAFVAQLRLIDQVIALFQRQKMPVLLILRDLHWAAESLTILRALIDVLEGLPLFILASFRTDEGYSIPPELSAISQMKLARLSDESVKQLTTYILGDAGRDERIVGYLQRESEGNVFYLVEIARALAQNAGSLRSVTADELPESILPGGVTAAIRRRLERVPETYHEMLQFASIAGRTIDEKLLAFQYDNIERFIDICAGLSVLEVQDGRWRFNHDKIRETVVDMLDKPLWRSLNRRVATAIEVVYPDERRYLPLLEFWTAADDGDDFYCDKIARYTRLAGEAALAVSNLRDALRLAERGLQRKPTSIDRMYLLKLTADAYRALSDYVHAAPHYELSLELARELQDTTFEATILIGLGRTAGNQGAYNAARTYYYAALDIYRNLADRAGIAECLNNLGTVAARLGDVDAADRYQNECLVIYRELNHQSGIARSLYGLGEVAMAHDDLSTATQCFTDSMEIRESIGDRKGVARSLNDIATVQMQLQDYEQAKSTLRRSYDMRRAIGDRKGMAANLQNLGWIARLEDDLETASEQISEALTIQRDIRYRFGEAISLTHMAEITLLQGNPVESRAYLHEAIITAQSIGAKQTLMDALAVTVDYLFTRGDMALAGQVAGMLLAQYPEAEVYLRERLKTFLDALDRQLTPVRAASQLASGASRNVDALIGQVLETLQVPH